MIGYRKNIIALIFLCICSIVSGTTYYVSSSGNDGANGTSPSTPWATLNKVNGFPFSAGDNILFNRGNTFYGTLKISSSGTSASRITFGAYGSGADPIISGFTTISKWTSYGGGIYSTAITPETDVNMVTVNGVNTAMGRYPDAGTWLTYESCDYSSITDNQLSDSPDWSGADVVIKKEGYIVDRFLITSHYGTTINYSRTAYESKGDGTGAASDGDGHNGWGYFIERDIRTLTSLGEWFHDGTTFYMYFGTIDPTTKVVKVASLNNGAVISGSYITIDRINFQGFNKTALDARNGNYFTATYCETGFTGVFAVAPSTNCTLDHCNFHDTGASGIYGSVSGLTLTNSTLKNIGVIDGAWYGHDGRGHGIINFKDNILIQYNSFINTGHNGVFLPGNNVTVDKNTFDNCCSRSFDQGAIYMTGNNSNRIISNNIILNTIGSVAGTTASFDLWITTEGIYLDEPSSGVTITGNTVANIPNGSGIKLHEAHDIIIKDNLIYNAKEGYQFLGSGAQPNDPIRNIDMDRNKVIARDAGQVLWVFWSAFDDIPEFGTNNNQNYARLIDDKIEHDFYTREPSSEEGYKSFAQWSARSGQEASSYISPITVSDINKIRFEYNASKTNKIVTLDVGYIDFLGTKYTGNITLLPYTAIVLMVDPNPVIPPPSPTYASSVIENATPNILTMTYNLSLATIAPSPSAFAVRVNNVVRTVNTVVVSGTSVRLTLASPVVYGDKVTVSYTKPSVNQIQTPSGGQATTIGEQTVNNKVNIVSVIPQYVNSTIENATPGILTMTYSASLASITPSPSAFTVTVNNNSRAINTVIVSGTNVQLTLASPVTNGDKVSVSYTKPTLNQLQTPSGGQAVTIGAQIVNNKVSLAAVIPQYVSSSITDATPSIIQIDYSISMAAVLPDITAFSVQVNSISQKVVSVAISGNSVFLTIGNKVSYGDIVTVAYQQPSANALISESGIKAATMSDQPVTNKVIPVGPIYLSSVIESSSPKILEITYDEILDSSIPDQSAFIVTVNGVNRTISSVSISGNKVLLTMETPVVYGDNVTISYIRPSSNELKKTSGEAAVSFTYPQQVLNNCVYNITQNTVKKSNVSIYPNPAINFINISTQEPSLEKQILRIFDLGGKLCLESILNPGNSFNIQINLKSGIYIIQIASGSIINLVQKLVIN